MSSGPTALDIGRSFNERLQLREVFFKECPSEAPHNAEGRADRAIDSFRGDQTIGEGAAEKFSNWLRQGNCGPDPAPSRSRLTERGWVPLSPGALSGGLGIGPTKGSRAVSAEQIAIGLVAAAVVIGVAIYCAPLAINAIRAASAARAGATVAAGAEVVELNVLRAGAAKTASNVVKLVGDVAA